MNYLKSLVAKNYFLIFSLLLFFLLPSYTLAGETGSNNPSISMTPVSTDILEGNSGTKTVNITISINECPDTQDIKIKYYTANSQAKTSDNDYIAKSGTLTFTKGSCTKNRTISIKIKGDTKFEKKEKFYFRIRNNHTNGEQTYSFQNDNANIYILNDDIDPRADLDIKKSSNKSVYTLGDTVIYTIYAKNRGPNNEAKIKVVDALPAGLTFVSVSDNKSSFNCSESSNTITCQGSRKFAKNERVIITVHAIATQNGTISNTAFISSYDSPPRPDHRAWNNQATRNIYVGVPGGYESVTIKKTVDNAAPDVGDNVTFTILVTNRGFDKQIAMRDKFPLGTTGTEWGTTRGAFEFVSLTKPADVTCEHLIDDGNPYVFCYSNGIYSNEDSFTVTITAKVLKKGHICNKAHSYEYYWNYKRGSQICLEAIGNIAPTLAAIPDITTAIGTTFNMIPPISNYADDLDGDTLTYTATGLPPGLSINPTTSIITGLTTALGNFTVHATVSDGTNTASDDFIIHVIAQPIIATANTYNMTPGSVLHGNVILDDTGAGLDTGFLTNVTANTQPSEGTLTIDSTGNFSYTPISSPTGSVSFDYTITDNAGATATATVTIFITTEYLNNYHTFELINPPNTRNIVGGYKIAGNTVMCLTEKTTGYGGTCHGQNDYANQTSNKRVSKYIDIDSDARTWNSTSSYIELPNNYYQRGGKGIAWAGLFWQGRFTNGQNNTSTHQYKLHYGKENGTSYTLIETGKSSAHPPANIESAEANLIKLKIDTGSYTDVSAQTIYSSGNANARTYAAFSDVTTVLQNANLSIGKHTFTVANLSTTEGREFAPGVFGGWSLVVIYLEDALNGSPRNISIYSGFDSITKTNDPVQISGFRLPEAGDITSSLSLFSGEGEALYRPDTIQISNQINSGYVDLPGSSDSNNVFDAVLDGILRDDIVGQSNNLQTNNNGVDIDDFNVSTIIQGYRDNDPLIQNIYIKYYSGQDYITPSMLAFSTELYQPKICYNYTLDVAGYVLRSSSNQIKLNFGRKLTDPLTTRISVQSQEGDFPLQDVNITYQISDTSHVRYITDSTALAPNGISSYIPAGSTGLNQTYNQSPTGFGMYIGTGASPVPGPGGTIGSFETRYIKFQDEIQRAEVDTDFDLWIQYTVDYGSGPLNLTKNFDGSSLCQTNGGYFPAYNIFNVASDFAETSDTSSAFGTPYNLYTQVVNRPFDLRVFSYDIDYLTPNKVNTDVEVELINADLFSGDTNISCANPDSNITVPIFVPFRDENSVALESFVYDEAIRTVAFRIWYLTAPDGSFIEYQCSSEANSEACFDDLYAANYADDSYCIAECSGVQSGCYACIRHYYGTPVCSRDNFSIRPESFVLALIDSNQSEVSTDTNLLADSRWSTIDKKFVAGYDYRYDVNATDYISELGVKGYQQTFNSVEAGSNTASATVLWDDANKTLVECNDISEQNISITLWQGTNVPVAGSIDSNATLDKVSQVGDYRFELNDQNWTEADWNPAYTAHHNGDGFNISPDCVKDDNTVLLYDAASVPSVWSQNGCLISSSNHSNPNLGTSYNPLYLSFYPYQFGLAFNTSTHPSGDKGFVYINTLATASYTKGLDENISFNIHGNFTAQGFDGIRVSNFVGGCYAIDTEMNLHYTYLSDVPSDTPNFTYDLVDYNTSNPSVITRVKAQNTFTATPIKDAIQEETITQNTANFAKDMQGSITMDWRLNFDRDETQALNPRRITFHDVNLTLSDTSIDLSVNLVDDYTVFTTASIDKNVSFLYASVQPAKLFYDDITKTTVTTPISVLIYCNLGFDECQFRGIDALNGQTSDFEWWKSWNHDNVTDSDGNIELESDPSGLVTPSSVDISTKGTNNSIIVSKGTLTLPDTVGIKLVTDATLPTGSFTDRWLIYAPNDPFYGVRFINESTWAGVGDTGHVVGGNSNTKKGKRLEW